MSAYPLKSRLISLHTRTTRLMRACDLHHSSAAQLRLGIVGGRGPCDDHNSIRNCVQRRHKLRWRPQKELARYHQRRSKWL
jgi:hypothetical protein